MMNSRAIGALKGGYVISAKYLMSKHKHIDFSTLRIVILCLMVSSKVLAVRTRYTQTESKLYFTHDYTRGTALRPGTAHAKF